MNDTVDISNNFSIPYTVYVDYYTYYNNILLFAIYLILVIHYHICFFIIV